MGGSGKMPSLVGVVANRWCGCPLVLLLLVLQYVHEAAPHLPLLATAAKRAVAMHKL